MANVLSYEDKSYEQKKNIFDSVAQAFENYKYGVTNEVHTWNTPSEQINGVTVRFAKNEYLEITLHHYENGTLEQIASNRDNGKKLFKEISDGIKTEFKKLTSKSLKLKKIDEDQFIEKQGFLSAEVSYAFNPSPRHPTARYLIRDSCLYEFDTSL